MARSGIEGLLVPVMDLFMLGRRVVLLRLALAKVELRARASSVVTAIALIGAALVLGLIFIGLLVKAGLLGLAALGLTPIQALLTGAGVCAVLALILLAIARSCLRRAARPLSSLAGTGTDLPATRP